MQKALIVLALIGAIVAAVILLPASEDTAGGPPELAQLLDAEHTIAFIGLDGPHEMIAGADGLLADAKGFLAELTDSPVIDPTARESTLGFDVTQVDGWKSIGIDITAGLHVVFDKRLVTEAFPRPVLLVRIIDRNALQAAFAGKGPAAKIEEVNAKVSKVDLPNGKSVLVGQKGGYAALTPLDAMPTLKVPNAFTDFLAGGPRRLGDDPKFQAAFAGVHGGTRMTAYVSMEVIGAMVSSQSPDQSANIDYYTQRFPGLALNVSAGQFLLRIHALSEGLVSLKKMLVAPKNVSLARYFPQSGWAAQKISVNLKDLFTGASELMPPSIPQARAGVLMAPMLVGAATGLGWIEIMEALSGQVMVGAELVSLEKANADPTQLNWLAAVGLADQKKGSALLSKAMKTVAAKAQLPTKPLAADGLEGYVVEMGPMSIVVAVTKDAIIIGPNAAKVKAALASDSDASLAEVPGGEQLWAPETFWGTVIDPGALLRGMAQTPDATPQVKTLVETIEKSKLGKGFLGAPMSYGFDVNDGIRLSSGSAAPVVGLGGVLAAIAIPAFIKYQRRAKSSEATMNSMHLFRASVAAFETPMVAPDGSATPKRFPPAAPLTPGNPTKLMCKDGKSVRYVPNKDTWKHSTWQHLAFEPQEPIYYAYEYSSSGVGTGATFTVRAVGDLDCDGVLSTFERVGIVDSTGEVKTSSIFTDQELE